MLTNMKKTIQFRERGSSKVGCNQQIMEYWLFGHNGVTANAHTLYWLSSYRNVYINIYIFFYYSNRMVVCIV